MAPQHEWFRHPTAPDVYDHRPWRGREKGDRVVDHEGKADDVEGEHPWGSRPFEEARVAGRSLAPRGDQRQQIHDEPPDEQTTALAQDEREIRRPFQPPIGGDRLPKPAWMV